MALCPSGGYLKEMAFTGLLNSGSILDELLVTWPEQFVTALGSLGA
jgi:hypothetical protein